MQYMMNKTNQKRDGYGVVEPGIRSHTHIITHKIVTFRMNKLFSLKFLYLFFRDQSGEMLEGPIVGFFGIRREQATRQFTA